MVWSTKGGEVFVAERVEQLIVCVVCGGGGVVCHSYHIVLKYAGYNKLTRLGLSVL